MLFTIHFYLKSKGLFRIGVYAILLHILLITSVRSVKAEKMNSHSPSADSLLRTIPDLINNDTERSLTNVEEAFMLNNNASLNTSSYGIF